EPDGDLGHGRGGDRSRVLGTASARDGAIRAGDRRVDEGARAPAVGGGPGPPAQLAGSQTWPRGTKRRRLLHAPPAGKRARRGLPAAGARPALDERSRDHVEGLPLPWRAAARVAPHVSLRAAALLGRAIRKRLRGRSRGPGQAAGRRRLVLSAVLEALGAARRRGNEARTVARVRRFFGAGRPDRAASCTGGSARGERR